MSVRYGSLVNVQVMAAVTVNIGVSAADAELTMYLEKASYFINDFLKGVGSVPLDSVPAVVDTIAEFYASGLYLARNNLADGQTQHPNVVLAEKKLAEYKASLRRGYKLFSKVDEG
ncbi:MAG: hypothetical protein ACM3UL_05440 [Ignavibacteria bacterium]